MIYSSKGLAVMLSGSIALIAALLLLLFEHLSFNLVLAAFIVCFTAGFLLTFIALEFLIFRRMKKIQQLIDTIAGKKVSEGEIQTARVLNPLDEIFEGIQSFAGKKQEEIDQLKKLEAFRKDFIANVSHELKTPIFAAQGFVHTLLDGAVKEKAVRKRFLKKAAKSLDGLDMLVQDLLMLSQIEIGVIKMRFDEIDLYALTEEVLEQFRDKSNKKEITLRIEGPVRKILVYADWQRISQVMTNLVSNAVNHSLAQGEVEVSFSEKRKSVITHVRDHGEGIPKEHINRIFERFYRVDKSRSREKGGTGLGLAIVKHILEGHHSWPKVESEPGKGSTFSFKLPRVKNENLENAVSHQTGKD